MGTLRPSSPSSASASSRRSASARWSVTDGSGTWTAHLRTLGMSGTSKVAAASVRIFWSRRRLSSGMTTRIGARTRTWQARRRLRRISSPDRMRQGASSWMPPAWAASSSVRPSGTSTVRPSGWNVTRWVISGTGHLVVRGLGRIRMIDRLRWQVNAAPRLQPPCSGPYNRSRRGAHRAAVRAPGASCRSSPVRKHRVTFAGRGTCQAG